MAFDLTGKAVKHLRLPTVTYSGHIVKVVPAQSGDVNSRYFCITLFDDRGDISLSNYVQATLYATLPDGTKQKCKGEIDSNGEYLICKLDGSMLSQPGKVACDVRLYGEDKNEIGTLLTSQTFYVLVSQSQANDTAPDGSGEVYVTVTPTIGENGNWFSGGVDTGVPAQGSPGVPGYTPQKNVDYFDGKSAYQYAVDGGFEGSEAEFTALIGELMGADARLDEIESQITDILYEAISIDSFTNNVGTAVTGSTVDNVELTWKTNKTPATLYLDGVMVGADEVSKALTGQGITSQRTFTLTATDERGAVATKSTSIYFRNYIFYGVMASDSEMTDAGMTRVLSDTKARTFNVDAGEGEYIVYALPARLGTCAFKVGGFDGGFEMLTDSLTITNEAGFAEAYRIYRSTNASLGNTTVEVK